MPNNKPNMIFGLYGAGGFAREIMPIAMEQISTTMASYSENTSRIFLIETAPSRDEVNGYPIISENKFFETDCEKRFFNIAISDSRTRETISQNCITKGGIPLSIISPQSIKYDRNEIGNGAIICAFSTITSNTKIGKFFHCNIYSYIAHDCVIGDYVTFAPSVRCNGNVHIKDHAYIGTGAVLKQGSASEPLIIGEGAIVGMGAVVTKNVPPFTTVVGNPAKPLIKS